jgi:hypothetical protein
VLEVFLLIVGAGLLSTKPWRFDGEDWFQASALVGAVLLVALLASTWL